MRIRTSPVGRSETGMSRKEAWNWPLSLVIQRARKVSVTGRLSRSGDTGAQHGARIASMSVPGRAREPIPGEMLAQYRVEPRAGGGGRGAVSRGYDTRLQRKV